MYHINDKDEAKPCRAKVPENCRFYKGSDDSRHYENLNDALKASEASLASKHSVITRKAKYSFTRDFKEQVEEFKADFEGFPSRFGNADLAGNILRPDDMRSILRFSSNKLNARLMNSVSSPSDLKMSDADAISLMADVGFTDVQVVTDRSTLNSLKSTRAWVAKFDDATVFIGDGSSGTEVGRYSFRYGSPYTRAREHWDRLDLRKLAGVSRIKRKTGDNLLESTIRSSAFKARRDDHLAKLKDTIDEIEALDIPDQVKAGLLMAANVSHDRVASLNTFEKLRDAQTEMNGFKAQEKYIKDGSASIATVWDEKKDTDEIRRTIAKDSPLNKVFRSIDLDNDVDPSVFKEFERDYLKVQEHLPKFADGLEPSLHIRKLGKHSSSSFEVHGLFNPARNSVAISLNKSGSTVHELFHQWDIIGKKNLSLTPEFRELSKEYSAALQLPESAKGKAGYYNIPTEQLARFGEVYMHEKIGGDTMLLDGEKLKSFDYAPIMNNPEFKKKVISFFESHLG